MRPAPGSLQRSRSMHGQLRAPPDSILKYTAPCHSANYGWSPEMGLQACGIAAWSTARRYPVSEDMFDMCYIVRHIQRPVACASDVHALGAAAAACMQVADMSTLGHSGMLHSVELLWKTAGVCLLRFALIGTIDSFLDFRRPTCARRLDRGTVFNTPPAGDSSAAVMLQSSMMKSEPDVQRRYMR
eukprot:jgi/Ulvmu1/8729/UM047_0070.1